MASVVSSLTGGVSGNSGAAGINYSANQANLVQPVTQDQINTAIAGVGDQSGQQQRLLGALQAQQGIQNQSSVFNQLQGVANGTGPNPAQAMLAQSTGQNVANQASLMAGQRGASQNVGLIARQAAQQGAQTQQQAAGQAASMQAQQSLGALQGLGSLANTQVAQLQGQQAQNANYAQNQQGQLFNALNGYNSQLTQSQQSVNQSNAGIANTVAGGQLGIVSGVAGGLGSAFSLAEGGEVPNVGAPQAPVAPPAPSNVVPQTGPRSKVGQYFQSQNSQPGNSFQSGNQVGQAIGASVGAGLKSLGNLFKGSTNQSGNDFSGYGMGAAQAFGYSSDEANGVQPDANSADPAVNNAFGYDTPADSAGSDTIPSDESGTAMAAHGGKVPALLSPGERYLPPKAVNQVAKGADPMRVGEKVPGTPKVKGAKNSYANDTVKATLEEGGIVLPRSVTQHKNPEWAAHAFVRGIMAKKRMGLKK